MRQFYQNKLWRDKAIENLERTGSVVHWRRLCDSEYDQQLRLKILEEAHEVSTATSRDELINELADVLEVIDAIAALHGLTQDEVSRTKEAKQSERGGFFGRKFVTIAEHPTGGPGEAYCLAQPEKYPEVPL